MSDLKGYGGDSDNGKNIKRGEKNKGENKENDPTINRSLDSKKDTERSKLSNKDNYYNPYRNDIGQRDDRSRNSDTGKHETRTNRFTSPELQKQLLTDLFVQTGTSLTDGARNVLGEIQDPESTKKLEGGQDTKANKENSFRDHASPQEKIIQSRETEDRARLFVAYEDHLRRL